MKAHNAFPVLGWGLLSQFPPFRYFPTFSALSKHMLAIEYHVHTWQVSPQFSCGDTCQIWMCGEESNRYICETENFAFREIDQQNFSNPPPRCSQPGYILTTQFVYTCAHLLSFTWQFKVYTKGLILFLHFQTRSHWKCEIMINSSVLVHCWKTF